MLPVSVTLHIELGVHFYLDMLQIECVSETWRRHQATRGSSCRNFASPHVRERDHTITLRWQGVPANTLCRIMSVLHLSLHEEQFFALPSHFWSRSLVEARLLGLRGVCPIRRNRLGSTTTTIRFGNSSSFATRDQCTCCNWS